MRFVVAALALASDVSVPDLDDVVAKPTPPKVLTEADRGLKLRDERKFDEARIVLEACQTTDDLCTTHLAGLGVPRNTSRAMELYHAAADQGQSDAQYML